MEPPTGRSIVTPMRGLSERAWTPKDSGLPHRDNPKSLGSLPDGAKKRQIADSSLDTLVSYAVFGERKI